MKLFLGIIIFLIYFNFEIRIKVTDRNTVYFKEHKSILFKKFKGGKNE